MRKKNEWMIRTERTRRKNGMPPKRVFSIDIEKATLENKAYRRVVHTNAHQQLVVMSLKRGEEFGMESHNVDQFIRVEKGEAIGKSGSTHLLHAGSVFMVPANTRHNVINTGPATLKLYTIYCPPQHPPGLVQLTKPQED